MKILITSDNHLGYNETDVLRNNDSFVTFEEILQMGREENVDFIIQAGDLFHYNKPSRNTYKKTFDLLQKYCVNTMEIKTSLEFKNVNSELLQEGTSLKMPFLSIHGNHDDPSGYNTVSPLDVLHSSGLIHYFGKSNRIDQINIKPILVEKDEIKVAVYGLGHIKDRRLYKLLLHNKVHFERVSNEYYNILVLHQNRVFRKDEYFPEEKIPSFFDLVIFGHEHLSEKIRNKNFDIIQVGSSVRTSLCIDESGSKYAYFIEFIQNKPKIFRKELVSVRYFCIKTYSITNEDIDKKLNLLIKQAINECYEKRPNFLFPLLRIRLETSSDLKYDKSAIYRIVENKIANPHDFIKIRKITSNKDSKIKPQPIENTSTFSDVYEKILKTTPINIFSDSKVIEALECFVNKNDKKAFTDLIYGNMNELVKNINIKDLGAEPIDNLISNSKMIQKDNQQ